MITPAYGPTATERVLPRMALDFTTGVLDPRVTFTRASTGTFVGSNGSIQTAAINGPRFDYNPTTLAPKGLLIEEQRTNALSGVDSVNPTVITGWTTFGDAAGSLSVVSDDAALAAAGLNGLCSTGKVFKLDNSAGTTPFYARVNNSITLGANTWAFSTYARGSGSFSFDVNAGTWTPGGTSPAVTSVYQRLVSIGASSVSSNQYRVSVTGGSVVYFILMQAEQGAFPTSVIPNTGTSITRNADVVTMTGTNFSDWYNASEGAVFVQIFRGDATGSSRGAWRIDAGATNTGMDYRPYGSNNTVNISGASQVDIYPGGGVANSVVRNVFGYKVNDFAAATNGGAAVTDTLGNLPTVNQMVIGGLSAATGQILCGHVQKMSYWPQRLTEAEIRAFSK
jgi:hypothetical protein